MRYMIRAECTNHHGQSITFDDGISREFVDMQAGLLDGSSPLYTHSPIGTASRIGKCGICGQQITCSVYELGIDPGGTDVQA